MDDITKLKAQHQTIYLCVFTQFTLFVVTLQKESCTITTL